MILLITSTRADWGLLKPLYLKLKQQTDIRVVATGSHLSKEFGYTVDGVRRSCDPICYDIMQDGDEPADICLSFAMSAVGAGRVYESEKPKAVIVLGDRFEIMAAVFAANIFGIPVFHIHGGEETLGSYDNGFRNAITAVASLHFAATERARGRIIQTGKSEDTVFCVGALGCEGLTKRRDQPKDGPIIFLFHSQTAGEPFDEAAVINAVYGLPGRKIIIKGGYDKAGYKVGNLLKGMFDIVFDSMDRDEFIKCLSGASFIIGNSSAGIIEAPALGVPTINIGDRQKGRERAASVIDCEPTQESIGAALARLNGREFQDTMDSDYYTPYQGGNVAEKISEKVCQWINTQPLRHM